MSNDTSKFKCKITTNGKVLGNWINSWGESIEEKVNEAVDEAKTKARDIAKDTLLKAYHTQKAGNLLVADIYVDGDYIKAGRGYSIEDMWYAEYGAGKVSEQHPLANKIGWEYDLKGHGDNGWWYKTTIMDKNPKKIEYDNGKIYAFTKSSRPAKFMYKSGQWLEQNIDKILVRKMRSVKK